MTPAPGGFIANVLRYTMTYTFNHNKICGLRLASYPAENEPEKIGLNSIHKIIEGAVKGIKIREKESC